MSKASNERSRIQKSIDLITKALGGKADVPTALAILQIEATLMVSEQLSDLHSSLNLYNNAGGER